MAAATKILVAITCGIAIGCISLSHAEDAGAVTGGAMPGRMAASGTTVSGNAARPSTGVGDTNFLSSIKNDGITGPAGTVSISSINALNSYLSSARTDANGASSLEFLSNDATSGPAGSVSISSVNALNSYLSSSRTDKNGSSSLEFLSSDATSGPAGSVSISSVNALNSYLSSARLGRNDASLDGIRSSRS